MKGTKISVSVSRSVLLLLRKVNIINYQKKTPIITIDVFY